MTVQTSVPSEFRAAGTDLSERRRSGVSQGPIVDLIPTRQMSEIHWDASGAAQLGASVSIAAIASDPEMSAKYPGIAATAGDLATPQIRHLATLGGNLAQRSRCWYYRNPLIACLKKGGAVCPARGGNHLYSVAFDLGPCVAPHPSSMAAALLAYDAKITTNQRAALSIESLLGDGSIGLSDHQLLPDEVITIVALPQPIPGERAIYKRAISRTHAEWPLVEVVARLRIVDGVIQFARFTAGGIAPVPIRLRGIEGILVGARLNASTIESAVKASVDGATPLPMTRYKLDLLAGLVKDILDKFAV